MATPIPIRRPAPAPERRAKRSLAAKLVLLTSAVAVSIVVAEVGSRLVLPVSPGARMVALDGSDVDWYTDLRLVPDLTLRNVAQEFDVVVTTTAAGHRGPELGPDPEIVFVGDSFTFGQGLSDEETFVALYCRAAGVTCANLGRGGTGTVRQLDILEHFLDAEGWRPRQVLLFVMAMSSSLMAGNDLADNLSERAAAGGGVAEPDQTSWKERILSYRQALLARSNLLRVVYFRFGPALRSALSPEPEPERVRAALEVTGEELGRLDRLSERYGFTYEIWVLHPVQDLLRGTHVATVRAIEEVAPAGRVHGTAEALADDPAGHYYAYDGHLNARGAARIAELLAARASDAR
jgi:hypothetical protein